MRIRTKLAIAVVIATVVLAGFVLVGLELFKEQTENRVQSRVNESANRTAQQINAEVIQQTNELRYYATRPGASDFENSDGYLDLIVNSTNYYAVQLIAPNGTVVNFRGQIREETRQEVIGSNLSDRRYVRAVQGARSGLYISAVEPVQRLNQSLMKVSVPVFENGEFSGILVGAVWIRNVGEVKRDRITTSGPGEAGVENPGKFFSAARAIETNTTTVSVHTTVDGERISLRSPNQRFDSNISASATVPETGWVVTVSQDRGPLQQQLQNLALAQGFGILLVIGVVAGLGFWEYSMNLSQAERLLDGFERLQQGDYEFTLSLSAAEEWRQISDGYNDLSMGIKEREQAIREREQRLEVLNRVLRHNLQNDMSVILSYAEMLPDFEDQSRIQDAADKILEMGNGLISHGKKARQVETAMESAEKGTTRVEVVPLVEEIVGDYRGEFEDVDFDLELPAAAAADVISSFEFAIENLVENAAEHNDAADPFVSVSVEQSGERLLVHVVDNGPGIPSHEYEVLTQGEETALEHGSGVGLWLAYWVVDKSGGELRFEERDVGGTRATIDVAAAGVAEPEQPDTTEQSADDSTGDDPESVVNSVLDGDGDSTGDSSGEDAGTAAGDTTDRSGTDQETEDGDDVTGTAAEILEETGSESGASDVSDAEDGTETRDDETGAGSTASAILDDIGDEDGDGTDEGGADNDDVDAGAEQDGGTTASTTASEILDDVAGDGDESGNGDESSSE
jgi:signal transduction histidine kinase